MKYSGMGGGTDRIEIQVFSNPIVLLLFARNKTFGFEWIMGNGNGINGTCRTRVK